MTPAEADPTYIALTLILYWQIAGVAIYFTVWAVKGAGLFSKALNGS